jgi:hypothetical protein
MKVRGLLVSAALGLLFVAPPVFAQSAQGERQFQKLLDQHPRAKENPALLSDPQWLRKHPDVNKFIRNHPGVQNQVLSMGAYDNGHRWHNQEWWYHHNPEWVQKNHPDWYKKHPNWNNGEGAWTKNHEWRSRDWWVKNHPEESEREHPNWFTHHHHHDHDHDNH